MSKIELPPNIGVNHSQEALISAYIEGYYARFEEYHSDRDGYESGFLFGLKYDPEIYSMYLKRGLSRLLNRSKSIAFEKYSLDEIQWIVFKQGFIKGYSCGFMQTKKVSLLKEPNQSILSNLKRLPYWQLCENPALTRFSKAIELSFTECALRQRALPKN